MGSIAIKKRWMGIALVLVTGLAAWLRLYHLGNPAFRADTIIFYQVCHQSLSGWHIFTNYTLFGHFPFPLAVTKWFIDILHLPPSDFMIRLPNALFGILTVLGMYLLGRQMAGIKFGVFLALLMAINPFHIQLSREAYFYSPLLLGITLQAWSCLWVYRHRNQRVPFPIHFHVVAQIGFFLMTYSHVSGWWVGALLVPFQAWILGRRAWREPCGRPDFWWWLVVCVLISLPLLFMSWGLPFFLKNSLSPEAKEHVKYLFGERASLTAFVCLLLKSVSWGATPLRVGFLVVTGGLAIAGLMLNRARYRRAWLMVMFLLGGFLIYYLSVIATAAGYGQRHVAFELPLYLSVLGFGVWHISAIPFVHRVIKSLNWRRVPVYGLAAMAVALNIQPAWLSTQLAGKPTPFKAVVRWCDTQLPRHTLVLVERWFDPWNELLVHNSTNIVFTFTVPAEPQDVFERYNWPATAKQFFNHFPDAAYLEYNYSERSRMGVVSNVYFARHVTFSNEAGIKLAKMGMAYRDDFYDPSTNKLITTIFYNTREDVIRHARAQGQVALVLYGPEWGYVKLWQQLQDFRDWRILEKEASLDVYNLTASTNRVTLKIRGMTLNGSKRVSAEGGSACGGESGGEYHDLSRSKRDFRHLQLEEWALKDITLRPGLNKIVFSDSLWSVSKIPLLVDQIEVIPAPL